MTKQNLLIGIEIECILNNDYLNLDYSEEEEEEGTYHNPLRYTNSWDIQTDGSLNTENTDIKNPIMKEFSSIILKGKKIKADFTFKQGEIIDKKNIKFVKEI